MIAYTSFDTQCEIIAETHFYFCDETLGNDELMKWYYANFTTICLAHAKYAFIEPEGINSYGYLRVHNAFSELCELFGIKEPEGDTFEEQGFKTWAEFLDKVDEVNNGRFQRHDEV